MLNEDTRLLLARCRRGDAEAQSELLRAIQPRLYFYCLKMLKDERRAQDTERKIFCEVLNGLSELKNDEDFPLRTVSTVSVWTQLLIHKNKWRSPALQALIDFYRKRLEEDA